MSQRSMAQARPTGREAMPARPLPPTAAAGAGGGFEALLERAAQEVLAVTYWFEPEPRPAPYPVTVRFIGHRAGVVGKHQSGDQFVHDETIAQVVPGSGPVALTARIGGITPGEWLVTARELGSGLGGSTRRARRTQHLHALSAPEPRGLLIRFWRRWAPFTASSEPDATAITTAPLPFAHVAGTLPLAWVSLVTLGMALALLLQWAVLSHTQVSARPLWAVSLASIGVGMIGAKVWFIVKHRSAHRFEGWCIQGFIVGASLTAALLLVLLRVPVGVYLDAAAPGLLFGLALGRIGCFFAGCCGGPPTASRWGVWSSDQRVGARRIPTQLMESALALGLGLGALSALLTHRPFNGALFLAGLAAYTLGRQGILRLRAEPLQTKRGGWATMAAATLVLGVTVVLLVQCHLPTTA